MNKLPHDSAIKHVTGESVYVNDIPEASNMLFGHIVYSKLAKAKIVSIELEEARRFKGVVSIMTSIDIPGANQMGPVFHDELCLAVKEVSFIGQAIVLIAAKSKEIAREAEKLIKIKYKAEVPVLSIEDAIQQNNRLQAPRKIEIGNLKEGHLADFFRRINYKKGRSTAINATARKLAIIIWNMLVSSNSTIHISNHNLIGEVVHFYHVVHIPTSLQLYPTLCKLDCLADNSLLWYTSFPVCISLYANFCWCINNN